MKTLAGWVPVLASAWALIAGVPLGAQEAEVASAPSAETASEQDAAGAVPTRRADLVIATDAAPPALIDTAHFAARSTYREFALSPDGVHLAIKRVRGEQTDLALLDASTQEILKVLNLPEGQQLDSFRWAGNEKLIMSISAPGVFYDQEVRASRLLVRNIRTDDTWMLDVTSELMSGGRVIHAAEDGSYALVSVQRRLSANPSVFRYELVPGGKREQVVGERGAVTGWYADKNGTVRLGLGWLNNRLRIYYRRNDGDDFKLVDLLRPDDDLLETWDVVSIAPDSDFGYILAEGEDGRIAVQRFDYSKAETVETIYQNPDWDVTDVWLDRDGALLAAFYTDDRERIEWFDEAMGRTHRALEQALGLESLRIVTRSRNNERMLVWAGNESDPGALYVFSPGERRLDLLGNFRPEIDWTQLAQPQPVRYTARDGLTIAGYLTLPRGREPKDLPLIVMPHGGPFGVRDRLRYDDEVQLLANRGYAVLQPNFRGSSGYGEAFTEAGRGQVGRAMQDDIDDAMDWAVGEGIADPARVCVVGGSYGGFAALWAVIRNPERYVCAASWAGVTDWQRLLAYDRRYLGRESAREWREKQEGEDARLHDFSPVRFADKLARPVLIAHGSEDQRVPASQYHDFVRASAAAPVRPRTLLLEGEGHSFSKTENEQAWYDALIGFLAEHNPADPAAVAGAVTGGN